jgi:hypothetical protein
VDTAAAYIRQTTKRVERLKESKRELVASARASSSSHGSRSRSSSVGGAEVEVQHLRSGLHAILVITGAPPSEGASFHCSVRAVEEAAGEVQNAHFSVVSARAIYTIHALTRASTPLASSPALAPACVRTHLLARVPPACAPHAEPASPRSIAYSPPRLHPRPHRPARPPCAPVWSVSPPCRTPPQPCTRNN